ncbi:SRPBCC family protein [Nocardioides sp. zg-536]|uniref:SRPBCC family protein n=1 Tax=Nocardioides faecalis TaxID=2803858 RepID=A0A938Y2V7_9ACTN|nr:SRPBCC family protein [Nocardioides faecalis]MBM9458973.1 SRPBCC family protein [Nocardioides faecalis]MBS4753925.1 SRPBCC family protein [Nocardioides faecalis]QVI60367.1 SRPBCC family protein [Nocardioides faecalis]
MGSLYPADRVEIDFCDTAPFRYANSVDLAITPEELFEVLADADAWPRWAKVITHVEWTTPEPHGVGTRRTVTMRGGLVGEEEFLAWDPPRMMSFRFNACSTRTVRAFAERYDVEATPGGCRMTWTLALDVRGPSRLGMPLGRPVMDAVFRGFLHRLRRYTDARFAGVTD